MCRLRPLLFVLSLLSVVAGLTGCRSRCSADADCFKACPCTDQEGRQEWCSMGLRCNNTFCEGEEAIPCGFPGDNFCANYAGGGLCGSRKCEASGQCIKTCNCQSQVTFPNNQQPSLCCWGCEVVGVCDNDAGACRGDFQAACADICRAPPVSDRCIPPDPANQLSCTACAG